MATKVDKTTLNAICPYFTMFPLDFPKQVLAGSTPNQWVLDPFCGRGTTNYAARLNGLNTIGIDSNPVAVAITEAKLVSVKPESILATAQEILNRTLDTTEVPNGEFWSLAYHPDVLNKLCRLRDGLLKDCTTPERKALRGIILGGLHGHVLKTTASYFSNQSQRTYSPKPAYAVRFWKARKLQPPLVDVLGVISKRAQRFYSCLPDPIASKVILGDSRNKGSFSSLKKLPIDWIVTSPPYYGMKSYLPDQWLRLWFLGNPPEVNYDKSSQLKHSGHEFFANELRQVWRNVKEVSHAGTQLVVRFGGIPSVKSNPTELLLQSFEGTGWSLTRVDSAGYATNGNRQAYQQAKNKNKPVEEFDFWLHS